MASSRKRAIDSDDDSSSDDELDEVCTQNIFAACKIQLFYRFNFFKKKWIRL